MLACGCATVDADFEYDAAHPLIRFTNHGIKFREEFVTPHRAVELLEKNKVPHDATIHILVDDDFDNDRATWVFRHNYLSRAGYTKSVLVSKRVATAEIVKDKPKDEEPQKPKIRYRKANE